MKHIVISLIPAKEKSSNLKSKNFLKIENKSLIEISILSSLKCSDINQTFVSSESNKILKTAKRYNCIAVKRPKILSLKSTRGIRVIKHFCKSLSKDLKKNNPIIIILQPTSPLRSVLDIQKSIRLFKINKIKRLISVKKSEISPFKDMVIKNKKLISITNKINIIKNRQEFPQTYKPNGAIFIGYYKDFISNNFCFDNSYPYIMNEISSLDIDTIKDFKKAKKYFKKIHGKSF